MKAIAKYAFAGALAIVAFDTVWALACRRFGLPYVAALVGALAIYCTVGALTRRATSLRHAVIASSLVGLVDATIGWAIVWRIGPGDPGVPVSNQLLVLTILFTISLAALCGGVGSRLARVH